MTVPIPFFDTLELINTTLTDSAKRVDANFRADLNIVKEFLLSYRGSHATFNAYRREVERFLNWSFFIARKNLSAIKKNDIEKYLDFCQKPPQNWVGKKNVPRFITRDGARIANTEWKPFVALADKISTVFSDAAMKDLISIMSTFFHYLLQENYVEINPILLIRQKSKYYKRQQKQLVVRKLSELQWGYVIETAELMAKAEPKHERTLFIMHALYGMYLRISELAASARWVPQMNDFYQDHDSNWWFKTVGKGNKERSIAVSDAMLTALKRYRRSLGLAELPTRKESLPILAKEHGVGPITSTRQIRNIVQACFDRAYERLRQDNFHTEAQALLEATVHWLRHTGISDDIKIRPREHVRDDAGHSSSATTDRYIDVELRERHASGRKKIINPFILQNKKQE